MKESLPSVATQISASPAGNCDQSARKQIGDKQNPNNVAGKLSVGRKTRQFNSDVKMKKCIFRHRSCEKTTIMKNYKLAESALKCHKFEPKSLWKEKRKKSKMKPENGTNFIKQQCKNEYLQVRCKPRKSISSFYSAFIWITVFGKKLFFL